MNKKYLNLTIILFFFISLLKLNAQIPNSGFENWEMDGNSNNDPIAWETTNDFPSVSVEPYTPSHQGDYAVLVKPFDTGIFPISGVALSNFPYQLRPNYFSAWIKANVMPGDAVYIIASLWAGDSIIATPENCTFTIDSTINEFTYLTFPITYGSALYPDSANIMIVAGRFGNSQLGTEIIVDDIAFESGVNIHEKNDLHKIVLGQNYPNPVTSISVIPIHLLRNNNINISIYNCRGIRVKTIVNDQMNAGENFIHFSCEDLSNGIYYITARGSDFCSTRKIVVRK